MVRGRWTENDESLAQEAFAVLILKQSVSRKFPKKELVRLLSEPTVYVDFLKLCAEYDTSDDAKTLRRGISLTVKAMGVNWVAKSCGISRVSLYRMLTKGGNPRLKNFTRLCHTLGLKLWVVDTDFVYRGRGFVRPRNEVVGEVNVSRGTRKKPRIYPGIDYDGKKLPKRE
jgi:probable addiction module antidote protein